MGRNNKQNGGVLWVRLRAGERRWPLACPAEGGFGRGDTVVVETGRGLELATVTAVDTHGRPPGEGGTMAADQPRRVVRRATAEDLESARRLEERGAEALRACRREAERLGVPLRPVAARASLDGRRITVYFTAEGRVDFRELVRNLAGSLKARVDLRQVGVRDEARMLGGLGPCGRPLCCATFLRDFKPVSIKMAKEQNLSLNPGKISGLCGRLMCCLRFEAEGARCRDTGSEAVACQGCAAAGQGHS